MTLFFLFPFLLLAGLLLFVVGEGSLKDSASGGSGTLLMTVLIMVIFLVAMRAAYTMLRGAYHRHGTVFQHPVLPPGMFQSPGGSWIRRNLLAAVSLFCLFTATVNFTHYAPLVFLYGDSRPWLLAFSRAMDNQPSMTGLMAGLNHYEPPTTAEIIKNLSTGEALLLRKLDPLSRQEYILSKQAADYLRSGPGAWLTLAVDSALLGKVQAVWAILLAVVESLLLPSFIFLTICLAVFGRALPRYAKAVEALKSPVSDWQGYVERLQEAPNSLAREHLWLGVHATEDYPVLLHRDILGEHAHLLGDSGSGKTALGMAPLLAQLIELQDSSAVVIIDLKGDMAMFQTARSSAGERFKFFTNEVGKATHVFNPFGLLASEHISLNQVCEVFLGALGLDHGEGYGRSYYSRIARNVLARAIQEYPGISSFDELRDKVSKAASSLKEEHDAFELVAVVESLAAFPQLNFTATEPDPIAEHAIAMSQVVAKREVVYFWLPAAIETASVREIAKLALYTLFSSTYQHQRQYQETPRVWVFIDEFQHIASLNFKLVLQQARSMGMGIILANQTDSDLWTDDTNLKDTVQANTRFKQIFSLSNPQEREELSRASGETRYYASGFNPDGELDRMQERLGPRLMENDIIAVSDEKDTSIVLISRGEGYSQYGGYAFPLRGFYHVTKDEYERRKTAAWPVPSASTLVTRRKQRTEAKPTLENTLLSAAHILSEHEPPPAVSDKAAASSWAQHLPSLYRTQQGTLKVPPSD